MPSLNLPGAPGLPPLTDEFSQAYWDAARDGTLLLQRCAACGGYQFYPRRHCAACFAPDPAWVPASGRGRLHTYTVINRTPNAEFAADCPYVLAIIELDEGPRLTARIVADPADDPAGDPADDPAGGPPDGPADDPAGGVAAGLACDARVRVVFTPVAGGDGGAVALPNFALPNFILPNFTLAD
jgi:uncharacterized protein